MKIGQMEGRESLNLQFFTQITGKSFISMEICDILILYIWANRKDGQTMLFLKIIFCILLCCPLAYGIALVFMKMVDDAIKKH